MTKRHICSDGNGGIYISKPFALISIIITILVLLSSLVFGYAQLSLKVDAIETNKLLIQTNAEKIHKLELTTQSCADSVANMQDDVDEMKADIKKLLERRD